MSDEGGGGWDSDRGSQDAGETPEATTSRCASISPRAIMARMGLFAHASQCDPEEPEDPGDDPEGPAPEPPARAPRRWRRGGALGVAAAVGVAAAAMACGGGHPSGVGPLLQPRGSSHATRHALHAALAAAGSGREPGGAIRAALDAHLRGEAPPTALRVAYVGGSLGGLLAASRDYGRAALFPPVRPVFLGLVFDRAAAVALRGGASGAAVARVLSSPQSGDAQIDYDDAEAIAAARSLLCREILAAEARAAGEGVEAIDATRTAHPPLGSPGVCSPEWGGPDTTTEGHATMLEAAAWLDAYTSPEAPEPVPPARAPHAEAYDVVLLGAPLDAFVPRKDRGSRSALQRALRSVWALTAAASETAEQPGHRHSASWLWDWGPPARQPAATPAPWSTLALVHVHDADPTVMPPWHGPARGLAGSLVRSTVIQPTREEMAALREAAPECALRGARASLRECATIEALGMGSSLATEAWLRLHPAAEAES